MITIRINVDYKENVTIIKEEKATNVFMIKNVFSQRKMHMKEVCINIWNNTRMIIIVIWKSKESVQLEWFGVPTMLSLSLLEELSIVWMNDQEGSWMKRISKYFLVSNILFIRVLFFQTFCEKSLRLSKIMLGHCSQLSEFICS